MDLLTQLSIQERHRLKELPIYRFDVDLRYLILQPYEEYGTRTLAMICGSGVWILGDLHWLP